MMILKSGNKSLMVVLLCGQSGGGLVPPDTSAVDELSVWRAHGNGDAAGDGAVVAGPVGGGNEACGELYSLGFVGWRNLRGECLEFGQHEGHDSQYQHNDYLHLIIK